MNQEASGASPSQAGSPEVAHSLGEEFSLRELLGMIREKDRLLTDLLGRLALPAQSGAADVSGVATFQVIPDLSQGSDSPAPSLATVGQSKGRQRKRQERSFSPGFPLSSATDGIRRPLSESSASARNMSAKVRLLLSLLALLVGNAVAAPPVLSPQGTGPKGTGGCGGVCKEQFPVPVCGSDGRIYHSECVMKQMTCRLVYYMAQCRGQHPLCPDKCLDIYDPVCGRDGKFYPNLCIMQRRNCGKRIGTQDLAVCIAKVRESRRLDACPKTCPEIYEPVCGSNAEVYLNECVFRQENCG
ncbi:hypothetical protein HPB47_025651 [Ixodes persulcatus]|uniref:Uncharacterized protein n=1 Tax=Ixodes persulcatus TaxID=34615 RepID=A0AC60Q1J9_IXOPE|nr:hypothetical protein HPB47_025651 [Ixodes persulcatus]